MFKKGDILAYDAERDAKHERDNKWADGTRVMVRNKPRSWSEATIYTRLDAEYWRVQYPPAAPACSRKVTFWLTTPSAMQSALGGPARESGRTASGVAVALRP